MNLYKELKQTRKTVLLADAIDAMVTKMQREGEIPSNMTAAALATMFDEAGWQAAADEVNKLASPKIDKPSSQVRAEVLASLKRREGEQDTDPFEGIA